MNSIDGESQMRVQAILVAMFLLAGGPLSAKALAELRYSIRDLGVANRVALGAEINNQGHVLFGLESDPLSAVGTRFLFDGSSTIDLTDMFDRGLGLNDFGTIVGVKFLGSFGSVVRYTPPELNGPPDGHVALIQGAASSVVDLNNDGTFVGWKGTASQRKGFVATADGELTELGSLGGGTTLPLAINDQGHITGLSTTGATPEQLEMGAAAEEAFLYQNSLMIGLGTLGGPTSIGRAINELGQVVGDSSLENREFHAFLYDPVGGMQDIGIPGVHSVAYAINDLGVVVGQEYDPLGYVPPRAFMFDVLNGIQYLNELKIPNNDWTSLRSATGINNRGQIVGTGLIGGEIHAFLLTPTPEPSSMLSLVFGLSVLLAATRCRR